MVEAKRVLRKWFELSGVVPLSVYLLIHSASYFAALLGAEALQARAAGSPSFLLELLLVWLPFAFHAGYGFWLTTQPLESEPSERSRSLWLRVSGIAAFAFVTAHAAWLRGPLLRGERASEDIPDMLAAGLSTTAWGVPFIAAAHLLGLAAIATHLAAGLSRFGERWGLFARARATRVARVISIFLFVVGSVTVVSLATGSALPRFFH